MLTAASQVGKTNRRRLNAPAIASLLRGRVSKTGEYGTTVVPVAECGCGS